MRVLAVVGQIESRPLEEQSGTGGQATFGDLSTLRTGDLGRGITDLAVEALEVVTLRATVLVSRHLIGT